MTAIKISAIDHVVLRCHDIERMIAFYCNVLGCEVERENARLGLWQLRAGSALIDLVSVDGKLGKEGGAGPASEGRNMDHFCVRVDDFDGERITTWLSDHGIEAGEVVSRYGAEGSGPSIYLDDPEGNTVELKGPAG